MYFFYEMLSHSDSAAKIVIHNIRLPEIFLQFLPVVRIKLYYSFFYVAELHICIYQE